MKKFNELREQYLEEKLKASDPAGKYIHDFVHSDNPKFAGKSKAKRIQMALAASYAAKGKSRNEEVEQLDEYGDTAKGQEMLTKVQKRAVDRVVSRRADTDPKYAKKNSDTANRAWERMANTHEEVEQIDEDQYDDMLDAMMKGKSGKRLMAKHSAEVQRHKDIESGKALKQHVKKNPGVLKTYSNAVKKDKKMYGEETEQIDELSKDKLNTYKKYAKLRAIGRAMDIYDHEVEGGKKPDPKQHAALKRTLTGLDRAETHLNK